MPTAKIVARNVRPSFKHDCRHCKFLGKLDSADLYVCSHTGSTEYVRRFSSEDSHYGALPADVVHATPMNGSAYSLAVALTFALSRFGSRYKATAYRTAPDFDANDAEPDSGQIENAAMTAAEDRALHNAYHAGY